MTPPKTLAETPAVAAALVELGVTEIYQVGGAQAVAALAYGTETIPRVHKITGPGNKYVAAAKKLVFGAVGIDSIAGPSEVVVLADETARADFVAADLLAQAEHGEDASAVLVTTSNSFADEVYEEVVKQTETLPRRAVSRAANDYGAITGWMSGRSVRANQRLAPEHRKFGRAKRGGGASRAPRRAIFFGRIPRRRSAITSRARITSSDRRRGTLLVRPGVNDFVRRTSIIRYTEEELNETAPLIAALAHAEGLDAHARSALIRKEAVSGRSAVGS